MKDIFVGMYAEKAGTIYSNSMYDLPFQIYFGPVE